MLRKIKRLFRRRTVLILSMDGGGVRGIIASLVLQNLEQRLHSKGCRTPLGDIFDVIAGSSTGALVAIGLSMPDQVEKPLLLGSSSAKTPQPITLSRISDIYRRLSKKIFPPDRFFALRSVRQAFTQKYSVKPLERILYSMFGDLKLQECRTNLIITAYDTVSRSPYLFKKRMDRPNGDPNFYLRDVARATTAAPTFFKPALISELSDDPDISAKKLCLIDGAMICNNPALSAYVEARKIFPKAKRFAVLSIGSGSLHGAYHYEEIQNWGYMDWVSPIRNVPLFTFTNDAQTSIADYHLKKLPGVDYFRITLPLDSGISEAMDDSSDTNMQAVEDFANMVIKAHEDNLENICQLLIKNRR
ncbi:MAG: patatin [Spirochaetaceae bacterium]|nr:MAG: patatin [Spirochaetaceae bacterium]